VDFASFVRSASECTGSEALTTSTSGTRAITAIGAKSFSGS
jgi:hypothetical protein